MKTCQKWFYKIFAGCIALFIISCSRTPEAESTPDNKIVTETRPFETTASEIAWDYSNNAVAADNKFKDATFNVSGIIVDVKKNNFNEPYVSLKGGVNSNKDPQFTFKVSERNKVLELKPNIKLNLQCKGLGEVALVPLAGECRVLD